MAFLIGGANTLSAGYNINNSVRFDDAAANGLARHGNNSRNALTFTISFWIKRTELGAVQQLVNCKAEDSGSNAFIMTITADDQIRVAGQPNAGTTGAGANRVVILTDDKLRDPAAWYHIVYRQDTTQSTAANRHILYINGEASDNGTYAELDEDAYWLYFYNASSFPYAICNDERDNVYGDFYMAEHHYCDGVSNAASAFGETDEDSGIWKPKKYLGSHGTYGHYLEFKQSGAGSGTSTVGDHDYTTGSASTIGADTSGNDNHFHVQGYATTDQCTDSPTNNFCTMNPLDNYWADAALAEGNLEVTMPSTSNYYSFLRGTMGVANGKWYWEVKSVSTSGADSDYGLVGFAHSPATTRADHLGRAYTSPGNGYGLYGHGGGFFYNGSQVTIDTGGDTGYRNGEILHFALDLDNNKIWWGIDGTWLDSGDPTSGATGTGADAVLAASSTLGGFYAPAIGDLDSGGTYVFACNFGNPAFAISSGNADDNGYGNFEFDVPTGFYALCSKNLAEFG